MVTINKNLATSRIFWFLVSSAIAAVVSYYGQPVVSENDNVINIMATAFSILAGFLITIMTIVATPTTFDGVSWRYYFQRRASVEQQLLRHRALFMCYLLVLGFIFAAELVPNDWKNTTKYLQHGFLFFGALAFLMSLRLPSALMKVQLDQHEELIAHHRDKAGITDE